MGSLGDEAGQDGAAEAESQTGVWHRAGRLTVEVVSATKLRNVQRGAYLFGKQDPYVNATVVVATEAELRFEAQRRGEAKVLSKLKTTWTGEVADHAAALSETELVKACYSDSLWERTRTVDNGGTDPVWSSCEPDEWGRGGALRFRFPGRDPTKRTPVRIALRVMDGEKLGKDREIGVALMEVSAQVAAGADAVPHVVQLQDGAGQVDVKITFEPWPALCTRGTLRISAKRASGLRKVSHFEKEDPFVMAELLPWGVQGRSGKCRGAGREPVWSEEAGGIVLPFAGLQNGDAARQKLGFGVALTVYDEETLGPNRPMGKGWIDVADVIEAHVNTPESNPAKPAKPVQQTVSLWDPAHGVTSAGTLEVEVDFAPLYSNAAAQTDDGAQAGSVSKKALLIGINYVGQEDELRGCHNDALEMQGMLQQEFKASNIRMLMDTPSAKASDLPTAANMRAGLRWLLEGAKAGDRLFLHFSGHGSQVPDDDGDEEDGKDEILVPLDMDWDSPATYITDDELRNNFFQRVPKGADLTVVFDCCHSGTMSDLKVVKDRGGKGGKGGEGGGGGKGEEGAGSGPKLGPDVRSRFFKPCESVLKRIEELRASRASSRQSAMSKASSMRKRALGVARAKDGAAIVVISGCRDDQTAADAKIDDKFMGATTWSIRQAMKECNGTVGDLLDKVQAKVKQRGWEQVPQLSFGSAKSRNSPWLGGWDGATGTESEMAEAVGVEADGEKKEVGAVGEGCGQEEEEKEEEEAGGEEETQVPAVQQSKKDGANNKGSGEDEDDEDDEDDDDEEDSLFGGDDDNVPETRETPEACKPAAATAATPAASAAATQRDENTDADEDSDDDIVTVVKQKLVAPAWHNIQAGMDYLKPYVKPGADASKSLSAKLFRAAPPESKTRGRKPSVSSSAGRARNVRHKRSSVVPATSSTRGRGVPTNNNKVKSKSKSKNKSNKNTTKGRKRSQASAAGSGGPSFLARIDSIIDSKEAGLKKRREKEAYATLVDKKVCTTCNIEQSYEEVAKRRNKCTQCGNPYRARVQWQSVQSGFLGRNLKSPPAPVSKHKHNTGRVQ